MKNKNKRYFDYKQYILNDLSEKISEIAAVNDFKPETIRKIRFAAKELKKASIMVQNIDWLLNEEQDEETFNLRWHSDVKDFRLVERVRGFFSSILNKILFWKK